jgi:predicted transcriptional regulator
MKTLHIGIASYEAMKRRTMAVAGGGSGAGRHIPKVWFTSMESAGKILSPKNKALLETIQQMHPQSLAELAAITGRARSNLSRTLRTMARYGLVELRPGLRGTFTPVVGYQRISVTIPLESAGVGSPLF